MMNPIPACVMVSTWSSILRVPVRDWVVGLEATAKETEPSPIPLELPAIVIQLSLLEAVQAHPVGEVTLTLLLLPSELKEALLEDREKLQSGVDVETTTCVLSVLVNSPSLAENSKTRVAPGGMPG